MVGPAGSGLARPIAQVNWCGRPSFRLGHATVTRSGADRLGQAGLFWRRGLCVFSADVFALSLRLVVAASGGAGGGFDLDGPADRLLGLSRLGLQAADPAFRRRGALPAAQTAFSGYGSRFFLRSLFFVFSGLFLVYGRGASNSARVSDCCTIRRFVHWLLQMQSERNAP